MNSARVRELSTKSADAVVTSGRDLLLSGTIICTGLLHAGVDARWWFLTGSRTHSGSTRNCRRRLKPTT